MTRARRSVRLHDAPRHDLRRDVSRARARASAGRALTTDDQRAEVEAYRERAAKQDIVSRKMSEARRPASFTGSYALNPATGQPIPIWIADYVLMEYGTGAIMAVPGHDERDFAFAQAYGLPIVRVVAPADGVDAHAPLSEAYTGDGRLVNSGPFDGVPATEAKSRDHRVARGTRGGEARRELPPARLDDLAAALLGPADPDHLLR